MEHIEGSASNPALTKIQVQRRDRTDVCGHAT
jgi:hypothetical protein